MPLSGQKEKHPIPGEPGEWIETQHLSWRQLEQVRMAGRKVAIEAGSDIPAELMERMREQVAEGPPSEPTDLLDMGTMLALAVTEWSYGEDLDVERLDAATAEWLFEVVKSENIRDTVSKNVLTTN